MIVSRSLNEKRSTPIGLTVGKHQLISDLGINDGGEDIGPSPHDFFDAALAACKSLTASWYANKNGIPLEGVEVQVERDNSRERQGEYRLRYRVDFRGPLSEEQSQKLREAVGRCPIQKLMTKAKITVEEVR